MSFFSTEHCPLLEETCAIVKYSYVSQTERERIEENRYFPTQQGYYLTIRYDYQRNDGDIRHFYSVPYLVLSHELVWWDEFNRHSALQRKDKYILLSSIMRGAPHYEMLERIKTTGGCIMGEFQIYNLDHLGLVAGIIDQMELVEQINQHLGEDPHEKVSPGVVVKAMILNGLGILSAPLYLFSRFFEGKATEHLLGEGVEPKHLNDDRLGRVLEQLWRNDLSTLFLKVSLNAVRVFGVEVEVVHLDSTSFAVEGEYVNVSVKDLEHSESQDSGERRPQPIQIKRGYSRDHRSDLKQFVMNLICSGDSGIPLFLSMADGNQVDSVVFGELMRSFSQQWNFDGIHVADAALYTADNLQKMGSLQWVSRVPLTIGAASRLLDEIAPASFVPSATEGYETAMVGNDYAVLKQHWVVVRSQARRDKDFKRLEVNIQKAQSQAQSALKALQSQAFDCPILAQSAAQQLNEQLRYHRLIEIETVDIPHYGQPGRPNKSKQPSYFTYQVRAALVPDRAVIERQKRRAGCLILATPVLEDKPELTADEILSNYKDQQYSEAGFRFCKDPMFFADSVFVKNPERIEALSLIMGLCLLVYSLGQRYLRQALAQARVLILYPICEKKSHTFCVRSLSQIISCRKGL